MIFAHLPGPHSWRIEEPGVETAYLVIIPEERRAAVWYATWEYAKKYKFNGYKEIREVNAENIDNLPPIFASYVRKWWRKWEEGEVRKSNSNS